MENASKALIMAGSILMSMIVIGSLLLMFNQISDFEQSKINSDEIAKQNKYMKDIEAYNKNIYGSELLSLANLLDDYKRNQVDTYGYNEIKVTVDLKTKIEDKDKSVILSEGDHDLKEIKQGILSELKNQINNYETEEYDKNKTIKQFSQMTNREIAKVFGIDISEYRDLADYEIRDKLINEEGKENLYDEIDKYIALKTTETQFKSSIFILKETQFDNVGRINKMVFEEYKEVIDI